jgi:hypothetical protein
VVYLLVEAVAVLVEALDLLELAKQVVAMAALTVLVVRQLQILDLVVAEVAHSNLTEQVVLAALVSF